MEADFLQFVRSNYNEILTTIRDTGQLDKATEEKLIKAINEFKSTFAV